MAARRLQMIYFLLAAVALGFVKGEKSAVLELTGDAPAVHFGELGGSDVLTLVHNSTEDELVCSGKIRASDVVIEGTTTTVAQMMAEFATMKEEMAAVKQFVGMMPPPASPSPSAPPPFKPPPSMPPPPPPLVYAGFYGFSEANLTVECMSSTRAQLVGTIRSRSVLENDGHFANLHGSCGASQSRYVDDAITDSSGRKADVYFQVPQQWVKYKNYAPGMQDQVWNVQAEYDLSPGSSCCSE